MIQKGVGVVVINNNHGVIMTKIHSLVNKFTLSLTSL